MRDYMKELKLVTLKLSRNTICKLLIVLDTLMTDALADNEIEIYKQLAAIRCLIKVQLEEHDAKEAAKHDS